MVIPNWILDLPPERRQPFDMFGVIATPADPRPGPAVETTVLTLAAPAGWWTAIFSLSHNINGAGFSEGSGALIWRLKVDKAYVRNYGDMRVQFGTIAQPRDTTGIFAKPGQVSLYTVSNLAYTPGDTSVIVSLRGMFYQL